MTSETYLIDILIKQLLIVKLVYMFALTPAMILDIISFIVITQTFSSSSKR